MFLFSNMIPKTSDAVAATANAPAITEQAVAAHGCHRLAVWTTVRRPGRRRVQVPGLPAPAGAVGFGGQRGQRGVIAGKRAAEPPGFVRATFAKFARECGGTSPRRACRCGIRGCSRARRCARAACRRWLRAVQETCSEKRPAACSTVTTCEAPRTPSSSAPPSPGWSSWQLASGGGAGALSASPSLFPDTSAGVTAS